MQSSTCALATVTVWPLSVSVMMLIATPFEVKENRVVDAGISASRVVAVAVASAGFVAAFAAADFPFDRGGLAVAAGLALAEAARALAPPLFDGALVEAFSAAGAATLLFSGSLCAVALTCAGTFDAFAAALAGVAPLAGEEALLRADAFACAPGLDFSAGAAAAAGFALDFALDAGLLLDEAFAADALAASAGAVSDLAAPDGAAASQAASAAVEPVADACVSACTASLLARAAAGFEVLFRAAVAAAVLFEPAPFELEAGFFMF